MSPPGSRFTSAIATACAVFTLVLNYSKRTRLGLVLHVPVPAAAIRPCRVVDMRIGVDATCWHNRRGYGRHARALLRSLARRDSANRYTLVLDSTAPAEPLPAECEVRIVKSTVPAVNAASADGHRSLADMWRM